MTSPRTLKIRLDNDGYYMELDDEIPWTSYPSPYVPRAVIEEAERLTDIFSETIFDYYSFNKDYIIAADH